MSYMGWTACFPVLSNTFQETSSSGTGANIGPSLARPKSARERIAKAREGALELHALHVMGSERPPVCPFSAHSVHCLACDIMMFQLVVEIFV